MGKKKPPLGVLSLAAFDLFLYQLDLLFQHALFVAFVHFVDQIGGFQFNGMLFLD